MKKNGKPAINEAVKSRNRQCGEGIVGLTNSGSKAVQFWMPPPQSAIFSSHNDCPEPAYQ